jgi:hypothetical protein
MINEVEGASRIIKNPNYILMMMQPSTHNVCGIVIPGITCLETMETFGSTRNILTVGS